MPDVPTAKKGRYHLNSNLSELTGSFIGRIFIKKIHQRFEALYADDPRSYEIRMMNAMFADMPLRALVNFSGGEFSFDALDGLILMMNGHLFR